MEASRRSGCENKERLGKIPGWFLSSQFMKDSRHLLLRTNPTTNMVESLLVGTTE